MAVKPPPSRGGIAYSADYRALIQEQSNAAVLAITAKVCCRKTLYNHNRRLQDTGSLLPYKQFGGVPRTSCKGEIVSCVRTLGGHILCVQSQSLRPLFITLT